MKYYIGLFFLLIFFLSYCKSEEEADYDDPPAKAGQSGGKIDVPVFVNVHDHPKTGFNCVDKTPGQYYADPQTKCAVYYICIQNERGTLSPLSFACPNGTLFSQSTRVCRSHDQVFCNIAERYYDSVHGNIDSKGQEDNRDLYSNEWQKARASNRPTRGPQALSETSTPRPQSQPRSQGQPQRRPPTIISTTPKPQPQPQPQPQPKPDYEYEYVDYPDGTNATNPNPIAPARVRRDVVKPKKMKQKKGESPFDFLSQTHVLTSFTCHDKIPGMAYADQESDCKMFHVCIPVAKGKFKDYQLNCEAGKKYDQKSSMCEPEENVRCGRSDKYYVYNKWFRKTKKSAWRSLTKGGKKSKS